MEDCWCHVKQMADTVACKTLANVQAISSCYFFNSSSYLIHQHSWLADRNRLVKCFLRYVHYLCLDLMLWLAIKDSEVIISVISIDVYADVDVDFVPEVQGPS